MVRHTPYRLSSEFSPREQEIYGLFMKGFNARQISNILGISVTTVRTHKEAMLGKRCVNSVYELMALRITELERELEKVKENETKDKGIC